MKYTMKVLFGIVVFCLMLFVSVTPAQAESITLVLNGVIQGTFACTGTNGCFGNDITLEVAGSDLDWTVTLDIDTTGNTNAGDGIAATSFILTGFSYVDAQIELTGAPGGVGDWTESAGPANANGCQDSSSNHTCTQDTSVFLDGTDLDASPLNGPTYTWEWEITGQTFGGFDENTHVQALFVECQDGAEDCDNQTGLISTHAGQVPEPTTLTLLSLGLLGIGAAIRRRR
jgi:hypothetical protein